MKPTHNQRESDGPYIFVRAPRPGDRRKRNAFGVLIGFGKAYSAYYKRKDREATASKKGGAK